MRRFGKPRRRTAGNIMLIVLAILFVLLTFILSLHYTQSVSQAESMQAESTIVSRQAALFAALQVSQGVSDAAPTWLPAVTATVDDSQKMDPGYAAKLFQSSGGVYTGLPDLGTTQTRVSFDRAVPAAAGHRYFRVQPPAWPWPRTSDFRGVISQQHPFAILAWNGNVRAESLVGYANPKVGRDDKTPASQSYSGVAPKVAAKGLLRIERMPHGFAWSGDDDPGAVRLNSLGAPNWGGAVGYVAKEAFDDSPKPVAVPLLDKASFTSQLHDDVQEAMQALAANAANADKTALLGDGISITETVGMYFDLPPTKLKDHLSLNQALTFPIPAVPGFINQLDLVYHILLHTPYLPDGNITDTWANSLESAVEKIIDFLEKLEAAAEKISELQKKLASLGKWDPLYWITWTALEAAKIALSIIVDAIELIIGVEIMTPFEALMMFAGTQSAPTNRTDEQRYVDKGLLSDDGMNFWAYLNVYKRFADLAEDIIGGQFQNIASEFYGNVTLVFFGYPNKNQSFQFSGSGLTARATWNVPRGRTMKYQGDLDIAGDLWIQRGATLNVSGSVTLSPGDAPDSGPAPQGRLFLEEGASLVVSGDFTAAGTLNGGSVVVAAPVGAVHPTTAALLATGNVTLPYGVFPGVVLDEVPTMQDGKPGDLSVLSRALMKPLLEGIAANWAKIDGPFHDRLPYMARFATTWQLIDLEEIVIPFCAPMEWTNFQVFIFRGLTYLYAPSLNFEVGENLLTHSDFWGTNGEGRVAVLIKPDALRLGAALSGFSTSAPPLANTDFSSRLTTRQGQISSDKVQALALGLAEQLVEQAALALPGIEDPNIYVGDIVAQLLKDILGATSLDDWKDQLDGVIGQTEDDALAGQMTAVWALIDGSAAPQTPLVDDLLQELPGVLVYSGSTLRVGTDSSGDGNGSLLATGMFVAEQDVYLQTLMVVGSACSLQADVEVTNLLFYPYHTRTSVFVPQGEDPDWRTRGVNNAYGANLPDSRSPSQKAFDVGVPVQDVTSLYLEASPR